MNNVLNAQAPSFLIGSSSIKARIGSKSGRIEPGTYELPALGRLEKSP